VAPVLLEALAVADPPDAWRAAGFAVSGRACQVGAVRLHLGSDGRGVTAWSLSGIDGVDEIDGLPTAELAPGSSATADGHPNGALSLDHLVVTSHDVERTATALAARGLEPRRRWVSGGRRYTFFRVGEAILELIGPEAPDGNTRPARFYGLAFTVADIDASAILLGDHLGRVKDAQQPGRRIATLRPEAGLSTAVAFMSPGPGAIP
jgi:hypothetical protein